MMKRENGHFQVARGVMHTAGHGLAGDTDSSWLTGKGTHNTDAGRFPAAFILLVKYKRASTEGGKQEGDGYVRGKK